MYFDLIVCTAINAIVLKKRQMILRLMQVILKSHSKQCDLGINCTFLTNQIANTIDLKMNIIQSLYNKYTVSYKKRCPLKPSSIAQSSNLNASELLCTAN